MDVENIGKFLLKLRKENNLTQKEIATLCNVSAQAVSKWERGVSVPDVELLERLSVLYRLSINEIISGEKKTIYVDVDKRRKIVNLTAAVLVFFAYLFNYFNGYESSDMQYWGSNYILKGYELIFNGIGGYIVVLSWSVFLILVSYLIIRIYLLVKILDYTSLLHKYLMGTMIVLLFISFISLLLPEFFAFPQLIILISIIIQLSNSMKIELPMTEESKMMKKYKEDYKKEAIDVKLLVDKKTLNSKLYKFSKISIMTGIVIYYLVALLILSSQVMILFNTNTSGLEVLMIASTTILSFSLATYILNMYKYIGSFNTKKVLVQIGFAFIPLLFFIFMFVGFTNF